MPRVQVAGGAAELGGEKHTVAHAKHRLSEALLRVCTAVVRRGIEVVDAALDGFPGDFYGLPTPGPGSRTQGDVRDSGFGSSQSSVGTHRGTGPFI